MTHPCEIRTDLNMALRVKEDVVGLDITVDNGLAVEVAKTLASLYDAAVSNTT